MNQPSKKELASRLKRASDHLASKHNTLEALKLLGAILSPQDEQLGKYLLRDIKILNKRVDKLLAQKIKL
jgi:hypothetical protein